MCVCVRCLIGKTFSCIKKKRTCFFPIINIPTQIMSTSWQFEQQIIILYMYLKKKTENQLNRYQRLLSFDKSNKNRSLTCHYKFQHLSRLRHLMQHYTRKLLTQLCNQSVIFFLLSEFHLFDCNENDLTNESKIKECCDYKALICLKKDFFMQNQQ